MNEPVPPAILSRPPTSSNRSCFTGILRQGNTAQLVSAPPTTILEGFCRLISRLDICKCEAYYIADLSWVPLTRQKIAIAPIICP